MARLLRLSVVMVLSLSALTVSAATQWRGFEPAAALLQGKEVQGEGLALDLPSLSENGGAVPLGIVFRSALDEGDALASIHVLATANPRPEVITFQINDDRIVPDLSTRIRLSEGQSVIAIAISRSGKAWVAEQAVRVTVSGCLMPVGRDAAQPVRMQNPRVALAPRVVEGRPVEIKTVIQHPMETGLRAGDDGAPVAQNLIESLSVNLDAQDALLVRFYSGTAANPYVRLNVSPAGVDRVRLTWKGQDGDQLLEERSFPG